LTFCINEPRAYRVEGEFPKLTNDTLPRAIGRTKYELNLSSIIDWNCPLSELS